MTDHYFEQREEAEQTKNQGYVCKHGHKSPCFGGCQCEGCVSDREMSRERASIIDQLTNRYRSRLYKMDVRALRIMVKAKDK